MKVSAPGPFGAQLKVLRETAGFTQEELATIAGLSVHAVSALERGERRRPHVETVRALSGALDLQGTTRDALVASARAPAPQTGGGHTRDVALPQAQTVLLGRDGEMQTLRQWLSDSAARLITLTGPGGAGKTRLAVELARGVAAEGTYRVLFVGLAAVRNSVFVAQAIAEALGVLDASAPDLPRRARAACNGTPTLLVLDNFEQVLDAAPLVVDLLTAVAALRVLVTSRAPLRVRGEREYAVGSLALDVDVDATSPADLARSPAVQLFVQRVRDVQPGFRLTADNGPAVTAICRRLDALPLALELAAPWIKVLVPQDLLRRLEHDALLSTAGPRDLPERQQTMNATVAWSYQLLAPNEQRVFRRLAALPGRFPIDAAAAVIAGREDSAGAGDEALSAVAGLIDKSLVLRAETSTAARPLYQMLETVRAYAALELGAAGERDHAMEGLVRYCAGQAALASEGLFGPAQVEWLDRVREDLESYRAALTWLIERGRATEAPEIAAGLSIFWSMRGHAAEGLRWYEQILNLPSLSPPGESGVLIGAALMCYTQGQLESTRTAIGRALALARSVGNTGLMARADNLLGHVEHAAGNPHAARDQFTRSLDAFRTLAIPWGVGNALTGLAAVALTTGDVPQAECLLDQATVALRHAAPWFVTWALYERAILAVRRDNADDAIAVVRESLTHIRELQDQFVFVYALVPLAAAAALKGDDEWAARILGTRDAVTDRTGATVVDQTVHDLRQQAEREVRARLGPERWSRAYAAGRVTSIDSLIGEIDGILRNRACA
jgi:predicted ATPase/DNA-binding XRE family transcriptional regulator